MHTAHTQTLCNNDADKHHKSKFIQQKLALSLQIAHSKNNKLQLNVQQSLMI